MSGVISGGIHDMFLTDKLVATANGERRHPNDTVDEVRVWEVPSGKLVIEINDAKADLGYVRAVAFSVDGKTVMVDCEPISGRWRRTI